MMRSKIETLARWIVRDVSTYTRNRALAWVPWSTIAARLALGENAPIAEALVHAVDQGWMMVEGGHTVCLTDRGRQSIKSR